jgi:hypothetical protein
VGSLLTPAFADLVGLRISLVICGIIYGTLAVLVLGAAGRAGCEKTTSAVVEEEPAPVV